MALFVWGAGDFEDFLYAFLFGSTGGVGAARKPPVWMKHGDKIEVEITKIGTLVNPIKDAN